MCGVEVCRNGSRISDDFLFEQLNGCIGGLPFDDGERRMGEHERRRLVCVGHVSVEYWNDNDDGWSKSVASGATTGWLVPTWVQRTTTMIVGPCGFCRD